MPQFSQEKQYEKRKKKWLRLLKADRHNKNFDTGRAIPGKFYVYQASGEGPGVVFQISGYFDDALDALAFYRFAFIPWYLNCFFEEVSKFQLDEYIAQYKGEEKTTVLELLELLGKNFDTENFLKQYNKSQKQQLVHLLKMIDKCILSEKTSTRTLRKIRILYNRLFTYQKILAWGSLQEMLSSRKFSCEFQDDIQQRFPPLSELQNEWAKIFYRNGKRQRKNTIKLKELLDKKIFDENNPNHISIAKCFLKTHARTI